MSTNEINAKAREYREITHFIKQLQDEADALKAAITAAMEAAGTDTVETDLYTVRWSTYTASRLDTAALKAEKVPCFRVVANVVMYAYPCKGLGLRVAC